jgi:hypothetical protein
MSPSTGVTCAPAMLSRTLISGVSAGQNMVSMPARAA